MTIYTAGIKRLSTENVLIYTGCVQNVAHFRGGPESVGTGRGHNAILGRFTLLFPDLFFFADLRILRL